jgi:ribosome-associated protein
MPRPPSRPARPDPAPEVSKTRRKREMHDLQALGIALVELDPKAVAKLDLPEQLADAIALARTVTKHEARRRQLQFIGRLMRDVDPAPIRAAIDHHEGVDREDKAHFAAAEAWRERLLAEADAIDAFVARYPTANRAELAAMIADARAERAAGHPPHRYRALFRRIAKTMLPAA